MNNIMDKINKPLVIFLAGFSFLLMTEGGREGFMEFLQFLVTMFLLGLVTFLIAAVVVLFKEILKKRKKNRKL
tara:strand:- start:571 stop:789 length:219 start_codon:yes stop_codon:yes gene_type:complete